LVVVPIGLISLQVLNQLGGVSKGQGGITSIINAFVAQPFLKSLGVDTVGLNAWIVQTLNNAVNSAIQSIPSFALSLVITLNGMYYLLCNWDELAAHLKNYLPFRNNDKIVTELGKTADAIIFGHVLIAALEGLIAFIAFSLIGVQASLIFAVLIFVMAFIPSVGPFLIWGPLALYYFSINQYGTMWGIAATGLVLMIGVESIFYTRFVGSRSNIHPFIMLIGVLGGISVFGIFGFIIGPLLLANSIEIVEVAIESHGIGIKRSGG
jgi:predicted PurR-regulated permease PerM